MRVVLCLVLALLAATPLAAVPTLEVSASPNSLADFQQSIAIPTRVVIGCLRFAALEDTVEFNGFTLTTLGTGDWAGHLSERGLRIYCDNFNGTWDEPDQLIARTDGSGPTVALSTFGTLSLPQGHFYDFWVVLDIEPAGFAGPVTFKAAVADAADVQLLTPGGVVVLGTPAPETAELAASAVIVPAAPCMCDESCSATPHGAASLAVAALPALAALVRRRRSGC